MGTWLVREAGDHGHRREIVLAGEEKARIHPERIEALRDNIAAIDQSILELVARRIHLAEAIASARSDQGLPLRDSRVEEEVIRRMEGTCRVLSLDPALGRELACFIIRHSVEIQMDYVERRRSNTQKT